MALAKQRTGEYPIPGFPLPFFPHLPIPWGALSSGLGDVIQENAPLARFQFGPVSFLHDPFDPFLWTHSAK